MRTRLFLAGLALCALACGTPSQTKELRNAVATGARATAQGVGLRFAGRRGADVRLYELPGLEPVSWSFDTPGLVAERLIGYSTDADVIYALTPTRQLMALDLDTGRPRVADTAVKDAVLGPDGTALLILGNGGFGAVSGRRAVQLAPGDRRTVEALFGSSGGRLGAVLRDDTGRVVVAPKAGALGPGRRLPNGPLALAPWGDAAAVATDTGIVLVSLLRETPSRHLRVRDAAQAIAFSSSGHRLYVATDAPEVLVVDRFALERLAVIALPAPVTELRTDPFGYWLLGRSGDSVVVIPQAPGPARVVAAGWAADLPAGAPDGTILVRRGDDVVTLDRESLEPAGRVQDGADDRWLVIHWDPRRPALQVAAATAQGGGARPAGGEQFVQVSSTTNQQWADDLARDLRLAGMRATVMAPVPPDDAFRVVIGPYATRDEAEEAGRKLGMPYWIFTRDPAATPP